MSGETQGSPAARINLVFPADGRVPAPDHHVGRARNLVEVDREVPTLLLAGDDYENLAQSG
jgi:hypothetical protein